MNKIFKITYAFLGGANTAFNLVTPLFLALLIIDNIFLVQANQIVILIVAILATTYRALSLWTNFN